MACIVFIAHLYICSHPDHRAAETRRQCGDNLAWAQCALVLTTQGALLLAPLEAAAMIGKATYGVSVDGDIAA
jgi:hypothetical protein